jgi:hypothetical protein
MVDVADYFLTLADGSVTWVAAPRINVQAWMDFWRFVTSEPDKPAYGTSVSMALEAALAITSTALDTLGDVAGLLPEREQAEAHDVREQILGVRLELTPLVQTMLDTADPSALNAAVVVPLLHGASPIMQRAAQLANVVEAIAPERALWNWGGVFEGETTLAPDPTNIHRGLGRVMTDMLRQLEKSAPGEAATTRERLERAALRWRLKMQRTSTKVGGGLLIAAIVFLAGALWESRR